MPANARGPECTLEVTVLYAGLQVPEILSLTPSVRIERILEANIIAESMRNARDVLLGRPYEFNEGDHPVCGLRYRVPGKQIIGAEEGRYNCHQIESVKTAFRRSVALIRGVELVQGGTFVVLDDPISGEKRLYSHQLNAGALINHYEAAYFDPSDVEELRVVFNALRLPYMEGEGRSIAVAIDRLGAAGLRPNAVDENLDLCIAAEIAFMFGLQRQTPNDRIAETVRQNAVVFFSDADLIWDRERVREIICKSYRERSKTMHGRGSNHLNRYDDLVGVNAQLREILKKALRQYVEHRPKRSAVRKIWPARHAAFAEGLALGPMFEGHFGK